MCCSLVLGLTLLAPLCAHAQAHAAEPPKAPNVLFLFANDQRANTIDALGKKYFTTPQPRLPRQSWLGLRPRLNARRVPGRDVCAVERHAALITEPVPRQRKTAPRRDPFTTVGYTTFVTRKWHNGEKVLVRSFQVVRGIFSGGMTNQMKASRADMTDGKLGTPKLAPKHACAVFAHRAPGS